MEDNEKLVVSPGEATEEFKESAAPEAAEAANEEVEENAAPEGAGAATEEIEGAEAPEDYSFENFEESEATPSSDSNGISDDLRELQNSAANIKPVKKKSKLMAPIIISVAIVAVAAIAALVMMLFFNKNIDGSWYYEQEVPTGYAESSADEPPTVKIGYYFVFEGNNKLTVKSGSTSGSGTYTFRTGSVEGEPIGEPVVDLNFIDPLSNQPITQTFKAEISGNVFTGKKLKLTSLTNNEFSLNLESKNYEKPELKLEGDFVADKETEGKWITVQNGYGVTYTMSYEFKSDGTVSIVTVQKISSAMSGSGKDIEYTVTIDGVYTCNKGKFEITYNMGGENQKAELPYAVKEKGNMLTISAAQDIDYYKVGSASADEILNPPATTAPAVEEAPKQAQEQATTKAK